jgi:hypothetical protein
MVSLSGSVCVYLRFLMPFWKQRLVLSVGVGYIRQGDDSKASHLSTVIRQLTTKSFEDFGRIWKNQKGSQSWRLMCTNILTRFVYF